MPPSIQNRVKSKIFFSINRTESFASQAGISWPNFEMCNFEIHGYKSINPILPGGCSAPPLRFFAHNSEKEKNNSTKFGKFF